MFVIKISSMFVY